MPYSKRNYRSSRLARMSVPRMMTGAAAAGAAAGLGYRSGKKANFKKASTPRPDTSAGRRRSTRLQRRSAGSRTGTRRSKYIKDAGNTADYSKVSASYGRGQPYVRKQLALVNSNTERTVWVYRNINKAWGQAGANVLASVQTGALGTAVAAPVHIFDLTCVPNANGTTAVGQTTGHALGFTNETASSSATWTNLNTNVPGSTQWQAMTAPNANAERIEGGMSYLDWVNCKLLFYGMSQFPTKLQIDVVQFRRDILVPFPDSGTSTTEADAFWQSLSHTYMWNPIHPVNGNYRKYLKVLKSITVEMDAKETDENTPARYKEVNLFLKLGRKLNYRWLEQDLAGFNATGPAAEIQINTSSNQPRVHPRARIFLMIRSVTPLQFPLGTSTSANTVTYDISLTKKHLNLAPNF